MIPTTNPTSTAIFKTLIALKTRNGILISPHPRAKRATIEAARIVLDAAVAAGAPEGIIDWVDAPSLELTNLAMKEADMHSRHRRPRHGQERLQQRQTRHRRRQRQRARHHRRLGGYPLGRELDHIEQDL